MGNVWRLALIGTTFFWLMLLLVTGAVPARAAETGTVTIHIGNVSPQGGVLRLGLYTEATYPDDNSVPVASADVPVKPGENVIVLHDVPPGIYAIETFQDVNANNKMDTTWFGFPLEPYGFSRDARPYLSKPGFRRVSFQVVAGDNDQVLHLQNSMSMNAPKGQPVAGF